MFVFAQQYGYTDRKVPVRVFQWKQLENLYFRDKKFSIEVHDAKRVVQTVSTFNLYEDALKLDKHSDTSEASTLKETSGTATGRIAFAIFERNRICFCICISLFLRIFR